MIMLKPVNEYLETVTIKDIEDHKILSNDSLDRDVNNLLTFDARDNQNCFYGNPFQYHFQLKNILKCKRDGKETIYDLWNDPVKWSALLDDTRRRNRGGRTAANNIYECFRINKGSVVMFKATTAKYIYKKYGATSVLDPCAGWGGRMLGAWSLGIDYTGIDTNIEMIPAYTKMINYLNNRSTLCNQSSLMMIWDSCLNLDFSSLDYDFVLTSPPYINMEIYEHMTPWETKEDFYENFLVSLWEKCYTHIMSKGKVALNISPQMYAELLVHGVRPCDMEEDLLQQHGGNKKADKIYIWVKGEKCSHSNNLLTK